MFAGFGEQFGVDREMAFAIARAFGGGLGMGNICGALSGAFMVLGFKFRDESDEREARYKTYDLVREFVKRFESRHGTIMCKALLDGVDLGTEIGRQEALDKELFKTVCPKYVRDAGEILNDLLGLHA